MRNVMKAVGIANMYSESSHSKNDKHVSHSDLITTDHIDVA